MTPKPTPQDLAAFREVLLSMRRELSGDIHHLESDAFDTGGVRGSVDNPADIGSDRFSQEFTLELLRHESTTLEAIDEALKRVEDGRYGRCEGCSKWIPKGRLRAVPHAKLCVDCKRLEEEGA